MTKGVKEEEKQDKLLLMRASMGTWQKSTGARMTISKRNVTPQQDLRGYHVEEIRGSYTKSFKYDCTEREVESKIKTLQQSGYKLINPQYPELQQFFRNGRPITDMDIFEDAIEEIDTQTDERNGLEFLMDNWK